MTRKRIFRVPHRSPYVDQFAVALKEERKRWKKQKQEKAKEAKAQPLKGRDVES